MQEYQIQAVVNHLKKSKRLLIITGAGLSADSNLPTYRGVSGLYNDSETEDGVPIEAALSGEMLVARPELTWRHISRIERACRGAMPNRGHHVIAAMDAVFDSVCVLTQNVDGFHHQAGSRNIIDIHGDIHKLVCVRCHYRLVVEDYRHLEIPPHCDKCGGLIRPEVVLFGEMLALEKLSRLKRIKNEGVDMVFTIGTSSLFPYIVEPVLEAKYWGVPTVEINPGETDLSPLVDVKLAAGAAESLNAVWNRYQADRS